MFTLQFISDTGAVADAGAETLHSATARKIAADLSAGSDQRVQVSRMRAGKLTAAYIIQPDGSCVRPLQSKPISEREDCKAPRTCFCSPCRAVRRTT